MSARVEREQIFIGLFENVVLGGLVAETIDLLLEVRDAIGSILNYMVLAVVEERDKVLKPDFIDLLQTHNLDGDEADQSVIPGHFEGISEKIKELVIIHFVGSI